MLEAEAGDSGGVDVGTGTPRNEPTIAVNPFEPLNVVVAGLFELRVSTDGGATFSAETLAPVPVGFGPAGDPSLAFDSQGRLFWTYLGSGTGGKDVFIAQVDPSNGTVMPGYPVNVTADAGFPGSSSNNDNDKEWLAADRDPFGVSSFPDRLYVVWTNFTPSGTLVQATFSVDQGATWSPALTLSEVGEGFVWPAHNAVAANGDVYVAYHSQPGITDNAPDGISGQIFVLRSTDGGASYPQKEIAFGPGEADITFNVQTAGSARVLPGSVSWTQGSAQPWILPDPLAPNNVYVIASDDPTNTGHGAGFDDMDVFIARSTDQGSTWSAPDRIDTGPPETIQFFPTAAIDDLTGAIAVTWYEERGGAPNDGGNFLLDLFITHSNDGGMTFSPEVQLNDDPFDPDINPPQRFPGPPRTFRIGEYNGVAVDDGIAFAVWTGSTTDIGQHILFDSTPLGLAAPVVTGIQGDTGVSGSDGITNDTDLFILGGAEAGATVEVFLDGGLLGMTPADGAGAWSFDHTGTALVDGSYEITAQASDGLGNTSALSAVFDLTVDTMAPAAPAITGIAEDTGVSGSDGITSDNDLLVSGTAEAGATVEVFLDGVSLGATTADGAWSFQTDVIAEGPHDLTAVATDLAGNASDASAPFVIVVDTDVAAPVITGITVDTGVSGSDGVTSDNTLVISGTAEADASVQVLLGVDSLGTVTADGAGDWAFDNTAAEIDDGPHSLTAVATDVAGNASDASAPFDIVVDTAPPAGEVVITRAEFRMRNSTWRVEGTATAPAGTVLTIYLNDPAVENVIGTLQVNNRGKWKYRARNSSEPWPVENNGDSVTVGISEGVKSAPVEIDIR